MAFTQDGISFIGTDGRDSLVLTTGVGSWEFPTGGPAFIEALGDDDQVTFNGNAAGVSLVAGDGDDVTLISAGGVTGQLAESSINGNDGDDSTTWFNITNSSIYGGQGADILATNPLGGGVTTNASEINGNKGDDIISLTGSVTFTNVYGGRDDDFVNFAPTLNAFGNEIQGNKGDDFLNIAIVGAGSSDNAVYGGQGSDTIDAVASTSGDLLLSGDKGTDVIRGGGLGSTGSQTLSGGDDTDILIYAGNTSTTMIGGAGGDVFRINAIAGNPGDDVFPFIEDFSSVEDNIEINIDLRTFSGAPFNSTGTFIGAPSLNGFYGPTAQFGSAGIPLIATTLNFGGAGLLGAQFLQAAFPSPVTADYSYVASVLSGNLTDGNLFKAANANQLLAGISAAAFIAVSAGNYPAGAPYAALGFTQDSRKLYAFTGISITQAFTPISANLVSNVNYNRFTLAQFATNNVNGSDIFLV